MAQSVKTLPALQTWVSIPGSGGFPGERNGKPFQYSHLGNIMDSGAWWAMVVGLRELDTTECPTKPLPPSNRGVLSDLSDAKIHVGLDIYILLCIEWITMRTYYTTGNPTRCSVVT